MTTKLDQARARAEANFRKEERAKEGAKAMMDYQANNRMVREKTERLRALRLAKEAADEKTNSRTVHGKADRLKALRLAKEAAKKRAE